MNIGKSMCQAISIYGKMSLCESPKMAKVVSRRHPPLVRKRTRRSGGMTLRNG